MATPKAPNWLSSLAKEYWKKLATKIEHSGTSSEALAILCSNLALYRIAEQDVIDNGVCVPAGAGSIKENPAIAVQQKCAAQVAKYIKLLNIPVDEEIKSIGPMDKISKPETK